MPGDDDPDNDADARSSFRLEISIAVGYQRKRALHTGKWEGPITSLGLLIGGIAIVVLIFVRLAQIQL